MVTAMVPRLTHCLLIQCLHRLQTLMYPDYKHMLRHFPPSAAVPSANNTLFYDDLASGAEIGTEVR